ncbi:hypothetical protein OU798_09770 [Prolixibacteraceae bacterium Z1-6]|uniref:Rhodanese domain-containing protein n=1 Tax=Draconibacterium aestuarii TaxID=2998507 RepID=A0A9X3J7E8_9BACT|nr:hypothetical protein [Prolixibacteraceae bacterium Z1-6]
MYRFKNLGGVIAVLVLLLILIIVRLSDKNQFKQEAKAAIEASEKVGNTITAAELKKLNDYLVVDLSSGNNQTASDYPHSKHIPFSTLLEKPNQKLLKGTKGKIVLYSENIADATKAWVILNQLRFKNIYILQTTENSDVFKYKFQPDTLARLE